MWLRHQTALAHAIAEDIGASPDDVACAALARFCLDAPALAFGQADPHLALDQTFRLLEHGWSADHRAG
ncbi:hypothetical protein [Streptomyces sioyaensis]|uniref:hypothetical protein n=1 Tax=Streptomyces sioyaensis TaxID=67364 RepID=UPI00378C7752